MVTSPYVCIIEFWLKCHYNLQLRLIINFLKNALCLSTLVDSAMLGSYAKRLFTVAHNVVCPSFSRLPLCSLLSPFPVFIINDGTTRAARHRWRTLPIDHNANSGSIESQVCITSLIRTTRSDCCSASPWSTRVS